MTPTHTLYDVVVASIFSGVLAIVGWEMVRFIGRRIGG